MRRQSARIAESQRASQERKAGIYSQINKAIAFNEKEKRLTDQQTSEFDNADEDTPAPEKKSLEYSFRLESQRGGRIEAIIVIPGLPPNMTVNVTVKGQDGKKVTQRSFQGYKPRLTGKTRVPARARARARTPSTESSSDNDSDSDSTVDEQPPTSQRHIRNPQQHVQHPRQHVQHPQQHFNHPQSHSLGYGPGANVYRPGPGYYGPIAGPPPQVAPVSAKLPQGAAQQPAYFGPSSGLAPQVAPAAAMAPQSVVQQPSVRGPSTKHRPQVAPVAGMLPPSAKPPQAAPVAGMLPQNTVQQPAYPVPQASPSAQYSGSPHLQLSPLTPGFYGAFQPNYAAQQPGIYGPQAPYMQNPGMVGAQHPYYPAQSPAMWAPQTHPAGQPQWRPLDAAPLPYAPVQESVDWVPMSSTNAGEAPASEPTSPASEGSALTSPHSAPLI